MPNKDEIIKRLTGNLAEIITPEEFRKRLSEKSQLTHYIGFEISGYVHIGQGIMSALVMKDLQELGVKCTVWLADWHTWINNKLDGTKETAAAIGQGYFTEAMKASLLAVGADPEKVEFRLASEWYAKDPMKYWEIVTRIAQKTTDARLKRSISIMGREAGENVEAAALMYPLMQVADILYQGIDIAHAGMDQRKAHVVMRDVAGKIFPDQPKAIALHHPLVMGLQAPPEGMNTNSDSMTDEKISTVKMSKSLRDSAVWIHDTEEHSRQKIKKAFCPEKEVNYNPILNWTKHILFWNRQKPFRIERQEKHGGDREFMIFEELEKEYNQGNIHPLDLKNAVADELIKLLEPVRAHFAKPEVAAKKAELDNLLEKK